jgi:hypothetical protein
MANFNPMEEKSLMDLLTGLQGGMMGDQAYALLGDIMAQQQARVAQRQERLGSLSDLLVQGASQGQTYGAAQSLADAYTRGSNVPPMIEDTLSALYPNATPPTNYLGHVMDAPMGNRPGSPYSPAPAPVYGEQSTSPVAMSQMSPTESIAVDRYAQQQALQADYQGLAADAASAAQSGMSMQEYKTQVAAANPHLVAADPAMFEKIVAQAYGYGV